jgi:hypothetical protein
VIGLGHEAIDGGLEIDQGSEHASFQPSLGQPGEEALDGIEPGGRGRSEPTFARFPRFRGEDRSFDRLG